MKRIRFISILLSAVTTLLAGGCADKEPVNAVEGEAGLLNMTVSFGAMSTRLAELSSAEDMNLSVIDGYDYGLSHVGLYIYYSEDYNNGQGDLTKPYIRNLKCKIDGNRLVPVTDGTNSDDEKIYIYDKMTLVAFYPYNEDMNLEENFFRTRADEDKYPITRNDYVEQYYIPYRASVETNPTISYYTELWFYPKHTYKVEIVVVSDENSDFVGADDVVILPNLDPLTTTDTDLDTEGRRVKWYDIATGYDNRTGGSNVRQYTTYIWTTDQRENNIPRGEILLQAGKLTLIASQDVEVQERYVYRYGYNMSTGEIFIPTSSNLIWDAESLSAFRGGTSNGYQVCDIDLDGVDWTPAPVSNGRYDGGGHKISNLTVTGDFENAGLFSEVTYNGTICNVNLIDPVITVNSTSTVNVGAICGRINNVLSQDIIDSYIETLPDGLSDVVKEALLADLLKDAYNNTSIVAACRVENPTITVDAPAPRVGTICGTSGETDDDENTFRGVIWSTYNLGGTISVNEGNEADNVGGYVGGFCGLNNGRIFASYTTIDDITFNQNSSGTLTADYSGFTTMGTLFSDPTVAGLDDDYAVLDDDNLQVGQMPADWPAWSSNTLWWPEYTMGWLESETLFWYDSGSQPDTYPILQWERR